MGGPYTTRALVIVELAGEAVLVQLVTPQGATAEDATVLPTTITEVDALIESYSGKRWDPPTIPITIRSKSTRMVARELRRKKGQMRAQDALDQETDEKWLMALATGTVTA